MEMIRLPPPAELNMPLGEAVFTQRAIRRLDHNRPVGDAELKLMIDSASKAPSGGNTQTARFLVLKSRSKIHAFGRLYHEAWWAKRHDDYGWSPDQELPAQSPFRINALLANEMVDAPAVVLAFAAHGTIPSSVLPAAQNLMLAARALGIGSVLATLHPCVMDRLYHLLEVPADIDFHCCIPLGYPRGNFGPTQRYPSAETTFWDTWGSPPPWRAEVHSTSDVTP